MTTTAIFQSPPPSFPRATGGSGPEPQAPAEVILIGHSGQVGRAVAHRLDQIRDDRGRPLLVLREEINRRVHRIRTEHGVNEHPHRPGLLASLAERAATPSADVLVVDCSADPALPDHYPGWLQAGIGVVTPNKHGFSGDRERYDRIQDAARIGQAPLGYSATVGAGLPVLSQLQRLRASRRAPDEVSAVVSGTLVRVFAGLQAGALLSESVARARDAGFTEPDPLEDLSGEDVQRKLRILLRETGLADPAIDREPVVDDEWAAQARQSGDVIAALGEQDARWAARIAAAREQGRAWIYCARFDGQHARVGPVPVRLDDPFARLAGSDNRIVFEGVGDEQGRLTIEGPGAGVEVTTTAVLSDLAEAAMHLRLRRTRPVATP